MGVWAGPAAAQETLAASCAQQPGGNSVVVLANGERAQTFTPTISGALTSAQVMVARNQAPTAPFVLELRALDPGTGEPGTLLASTNVDDATASMGATALITGAFASPFNVVAGQEYALVAKRAADWTVERTTLGCPGRFWFRSNDADSWAPNDTFDMVFNVFVTPPAPEPEPEPPANDAAPPDTTITSGPEGKTKKKSATFTFTGTDARALASFQCKLDDGAFAACTSPKTYTGLKKGPHTFSVRAVDAAGNADPSPATRTWKVKRKKKKRR